jgi:hypothetical protein
MKVDTQAAREFSEGGDCYTGAEVRLWVHNLADEVDRLRGRLGEAADKALTHADSYEMAVARLVLAMDYMHPEQKRAFNAAWAEKRAELRAVGLRA